MCLISNSLRLAVKSNRSLLLALPCRCVTSRPHSRYHVWFKISLSLIGLFDSCLFLENGCCDDPSCSVKVFTERYEWFSPHGCRTLRTDHTLRQMFFLPAASLHKRWRNQSIFVASVPTEIAKYNYNKKAAIKVMLFICVSDSSRHINLMKKHI